MSHQLENPAQGRLRGGIRGEVVNSEAELHRSAQKALQERIVQLLRDARALCQTLFEADSKALRELAKSQLIKRQYSECGCEQSGEPKPPGLPEERQNLESDDGFHRVPNTIGISRDHTESVRARAEIGIGGFARGGRLAPAGIVFLQFVPESYPIRFS